MNLRLRVMRKRDAWFGLGDVSTSVQILGDHRGVYAAAAYRRAGMRACRLWPQALGYVVDGMIWTGEPMRRPLRARDTEYWT